MAHWGLLRKKKIVLQGTSKGKLHECPVTLLLELTENVEVEPPPNRFRHYLAINGQLHIPAVFSFEESLSTH
jgi:hypothetical protein